MLLIITIINMGKKIYINLMINYFSKNNYEIITMFYLQTDGDFDKILSKSQNGMYFFILISNFFLKSIHGFSSEPFID